MDPNFKNRKNSALIPQYNHKFLWSCTRAATADSWYRKPSPRSTGVPLLPAAESRGQHIKTDICEIIIYFGSFTIIETFTYHFCKMLRGCYLCNFYFFISPTNQ